MKTKLVGAMLALGLLTGLFLAAPPAAAVASVSIDPPKYHPFYYVPGEQMQFTIDILTTDPRDYDVVVVWDDTVTRTNWSGPPNGNHQFDDVNVPTPGTTLVLTFNIPSNMPDGDFYYVEVYDATEIETPTGVWIDRAQFAIRTWTLNLELNKIRYLPGDTVQVLWSVNLIRDGSLAPTGSGQIWAWDWPTNNRLDLNPWPYGFSAPTGSVSFDLLGSIPTNRWVTVYAYFNDSATGAIRSGYDSASAPVDGLRMMVSVPSGSYEPAAIVIVDLDAKITDFAPNFGDPGAAGIEIDVSVTDLTTGQAIPQYGATSLFTDVHGNAQHVFQLNDSIPDGTMFEVRADGDNGAVQSFATDTFFVNSNAGMSLVLTFNKNQYISGDTVQITALVSGSSGPFTYTYEARDAGSGNTLLNRQTTNQNTYSFAIPADYSGTISFVVSADDGNGGRVQSSRTFNVAFGILTVTLDRSEYVEGNTITASFSLTSNVLTGATYYYEILDSGGFPDVLIESGIATGSSVSYTVPAPPAGVPANEYTFRITAARDGQALSGQAIAYLASGYLLSISVDRASYRPGETMQIAYSLIARGRSALPSAFNFVIALAGAPARSVQTTSATGVLTYTVPGGVNEGQLFLQVYETGTFAQAIEVVTIGDTNPLMTLVGGVPTIVWIIALLLLFAFILIVMMWRKMMAGAPGPKAAPSGPSAPAPPPVTAAPGPAPMTVSCKACGAAIEITTSKRPIEVMCPSCGETQMVQ